MAISKVPVPSKTEKKSAAKPPAKKVPPQTVPQASEGKVFMSDVVTGMRITVQFPNEQQSSFVVDRTDVPAVCKALGNPEVPENVSWNRLKWKDSLKRPYGG